MSTATGPETGQTVLMNTDTAPHPARALTAEDRCDRCQAQAYLRVTLPSGGELLFCAHHGREHEDAIKAVATDIYDDTARLAPATG